MTMLLAGIIKTVLFKVSSFCQKVVIFFGEGGGNFDMPVSI